MMARNTFKTSLLLTLTLIFFLESCSAQPLATELSETPSMEKTMQPTTTQYSPSSLVPEFTPGSFQPPITLTPTQQITPTMFIQTPRLTDLEREKLILELIKINMECELPCWWGIVPEKTTWTETVHFLDEVGLDTYPYKLSGDTIAHEVGGVDFKKMQIYNTFSFYEKSGSVDAIVIRSEGHNLAGFLQVWEAYQPQVVIQKYGQPSRIWISSSYSYGITKRRGYDLLFFYDQLGFLIVYSGIVEFKPTYHICPWIDQAEDIQILHIYLQSPENPRPLERLTPYLEHPEYTKPIEAGGLSVDDIFSLFLEEEQSCFDFPGNIFP